MSAEPEVSYFASMCPLIDVEVIKEVLTANKHDPNKKSSTHLADLFLQMNAVRTEVFQLTLSWYQRCGL